MRRREPLPGTLVRTPSAFGDFAVSQTFTVAQKGRWRFPASERFGFERAEAARQATRLPWPVSACSAGPRR